jgi:membrane fusion protein
MSRIESIVAGLRRRHQLARLAQERTHGLYKQGFISKEGLQAREAEVIDAYGRLTAMLRDEVSMRRQLQERLTEQRSLPARQSSQRLQLERALAMVHQEAAENAGRRGILVKAPQSGVVTAVLGEVGQALSGNEQLLAIVPEKADRIAHLYAASSGIAFVREGTQVMLRFEAFPFQKYGHGHGVVTQVSRVPVSATQGGEPLYRVSVALAKQYHRSGKGNMPLVPGMRVDADLLLDTRKLYEWALDPIFGMTKIFAAAGGQHDAR